LRIAINVSKSSAMLLAKTGRRIQNILAVQIFGEPIQWVDVITVGNNYLLSVWSKLFSGM